MDKKNFDYTASDDDRSGQNFVGGWACKQSKTVYENPWIRLRHEVVERPNGTEGIYGLVQFKSRALGVVAIDTDNNLVLVKQSRYALNESALELPEGGGPMDEEPVHAAQRELEEETGLLADSWEKILTIHTSNSVCDEIAYVYLATELREGQQNLEDTEDIEVLRMPVVDAVNMARSGEITDSMTVAALFRIALDYPQYLTQ